MFDQKFHFTPPKLQICRHAKENFAPPSGPTTCPCMPSAIAPFLVTLERSKVISYSHPLGDLHHKLFIKTPSDTFNAAAYTKTLRGQVWIPIGVFCLLESILKGAICT